jgi:hypothetical protein
MITFFFVSERNVRLEYKILLLVAGVINVKRKGKDAGRVICKYDERT